MKIKNHITALLVVFILTSCAPTAKVVPTETTVPISTEITLFVGSEQVDCPYLAKCYKVKYSADDPEWKTFSDPIQGFDWEVGYEYELRVKVAEIRQKNSDFIFRSYMLIEVVSKVKVQ
jgi:hypothetical protein